MRQLQKYLRNRAIVGPWQIAGVPRTDYKSAVVIPALAELQTLPQTLACLAANPAELLQQTLIVVVVNNRVEIPAETRCENRQTLAWLQTNPYPQLKLAWVDASSAGLELPARDGVGLARKIGFDLALARLQWDAAPLLISLDADTLVDSDYLPAIYAHFNRSHCGGATLPFRHQQAADPRQEQAIRRYELYLRSYLFGLQQAGSRYAFHSMGSAFACRASAYVNVGGMNRRQAAEDFYFLQQLEKTAGVEMLPGTLVAPSPRFSGRVPFGTGRAVQQQLEQGEQPFRFVPLAAFGLLRDWLQLVTDHWDRTAEFLLTRAALLSPVLGDFLQQLGFASSWAKLQKNHVGQQQFSAAFHRWFDGLRTRQFLMRVSVDAADIAVEESVCQLLMWGGQAKIVEESQQLRLLETLQGGG